MNKSSVALSAAVLAIAIAAAYLWQELRTSREQIAALQTRVNELQNAQMLGRTAPSSVNAPAPSSASAASAAPGETAAAPTAPARPGENRAAMADMVKQLINSPEARNMGRMMLAQSLPDLGKELNLNPTEEEKLLDLIARQQADTAGEAIGMLGQAQDPAARQQLQRQIEEKQKANQAEIASMLGSRYPQYQQYQDTLPTRNQVNQLKAQLGTGSNALSDAQSKSLITALAAEQKRINEQPRIAVAAGSNPQTFMAEQARRREDNNRRLADAAATQLNAQQLDTYKKMLEQRNFGNLQGGARRQGGAGLPAGF